HAVDRGAAARRRGRGGGGGDLGTPLRGYSISGGGGCGYSISGGGGCGYPISGGGELSGCGGRSASEQRLVLRMPLDVGGDERALRHDARSLLRGHGIQCGLREHRAEPALLDGGVDLGVGEGDDPGLARVERLADGLAVALEHEAVAFGDVDDLIAHASTVSGYSEPRSMMRVGIIVIWETVPPAVRCSSTSTIGRPCSTVGCSTDVSGGLDDCAA